MGLTRAEIHAILKERFPDAVLEEQLSVPDPFIVVRPESLPDLAFFCRDDPRLRLDLLSAITGVDYPPRSVIEVIYCMESTATGSTLILKVAVSRQEPKVPTVERVWRTADWHERETYDLLGVIFEGHHNLTRILCAEDWEGHPLRKDYVIPETYRGIKNVVY
jgi:NADH-quinone oxidoreductase subunit C